MSLAYKVLVFLYDLYVIIERKRCCQRSPELLGLVLVISVVSFLRPASVSSRLRMQSRGAVARMLFVIRCKCVCVCVCLLFRL